MNEIEKGDMVVCINAGQIDKFSPRQILKKGHPYVVQNVDGEMVYIINGHGFYYKRFIKVRI